MITLVPSFYIICDLNNVVTRAVAAVHFVTEPYNVTEPYKCTCNKVVTRPLSASQKKFKYGTSLIQRRPKGLAKNQESTPLMEPVYLPQPTYLPPMYGSDVWGEAGVCVLYTTVYQVWVLVWI